MKEKSPKKECSICGLPFPKKIGGITYSNGTDVCFRGDCVERYKNSLSTGTRL